jgi:hypothetical protein
MANSGAVLGMSKHKIVSFIKSGIRIAGCTLGIAAFWGHFLPMHAFVFLLLAEIAGIIEERYETFAPVFFSGYTQRTLCTAQALNQGGLYSHQSDHSGDPK